MLQLRRGAIHNALVCAHDEMTPSYHALLCKGGYLKDKHATECAVSMMLSTEDNGRALCEVADVRILYRPTEAEKQEALDNIGANGAELIDGHTGLFGTCYTSPALDLYAAAHTMNGKPVVVRYGDDKYYTLILIRP